MVQGASLLGTASLGIVEQHVTSVVLAQSLHCFDLVCFKLVSLSNSAHQCTDFCLVCAVPFILSERGLCTQAHVCRPVNNWAIVSPAWWEHQSMTM